MSAVSALKLVITVGVIMPILACAASTPRADSEPSDAPGRADEAGRPSNGRTAHVVSRADENCNARVSKVSVNVRLSVQHKCHSVMPPWYQVLA